jgi:hypothetical protein
LRVHTNLVASAISDDGRWLVVSDAYEMKLFLLQAGVRGLSFTAKRLCLFTSPYAVLGRRLEARARSRLPENTSRTPS